MIVYRDKQIYMQINIEPLDTVDTVVYGIQKEDLP